MNSTTMTIRIPLDLHDKLGRLAQGTRRSRSYLAGEALAAYVDHELAIITGIERGMAEVAAGRTVPHEAAMDQVDAAITKARIQNR